MNIWFSLLGVTVYFISEWTKLCSLSKWALALENKVFILIRKFWKYTLLVHTANRFLAKIHFATKKKIFQHFFLLLSFCQAITNNDFVKSYITCVQTSSNCTIFCYKSFWLDLFLDMCCFMSQKNLSSCSVFSSLVHSSPIIFQFNILV